MTLEQVVRQLRRANEVARRALTLGRHPFGALLVAPDGETVLADQGVTSGTGPGVFSPYGKVTRGQMAVFLWRSAGAQDKDASNDLTDVNARSY